MSRKSTSGTRHAGTQARGGKKWGTEEHVPGDIFSLFTQREIAGTCSSKFLILASFLGNMFPLIIHYKPNFHLFR